MKGKRGLVVLITAILFGSIMMNFSSTEAAGCYTLYYDVDCDIASNYQTWPHATIGLYDNPAEVRLGNADKTAADKVGTWFRWGKAFYIYIDTVLLPFSCKEFFSGYLLNHGYWSCRSGNAPGDFVAGCWHLEKSSQIQSDCPWFGLYLKGKTKEASPDTDAAIESDDEKEN